jgi:hypothetical protein
MTGLFNNMTIIAVILGILELIEDFTGWKTGVTQEWITAVLAVITPILAWFGGRAAV